MHNNTTRNILAVTTLAIGALFVPALSAEQVYKCTNPDGSVRFSDTVCETAKSEVVDIVVNEAMDSSDIRAKMKAQEEETRKKEAEAAAKPAEKSSGEDESGQASGSTSATCKSARRILSFYDDGNLDTLQETLKAKADVEAACGEKVITKKEIAAKEKENRDSMRPIIVQQPATHRRAHHCDAFGCPDDDDMHQRRTDDHTGNRKSSDSGKGMLTAPR